MKNLFRLIGEQISEADPSVGFCLEFWDGEKLCFGDRIEVNLRMCSRECARHILKKGFHGLGEAYMYGHAEVEGDLRELLRLGFAIQFDGLRRPLFYKLHSLTESIVPNTPLRARKYASKHYDLGNDFYELFLDKSMAYSCAYFRNGDDTIEEAQQNKYELIARKLMLKPDERVIDIGCGWGGMLIYAARKYGITGVGITLSRNQYEYANRMIRELGLKKRIEVVLEDYRQFKGEFDKFVSIGMFEHVGRKFIPAFMEKASELLVKGGLGLLHTIGKDIYSPTDTWMTQYIFPGGYLPNLPEIVQEMGRSGLSVIDMENLRLHYSRTLDLWVENFEKNAPRVKEMFGEVFVRMWRFYLLSCSAGFKYGFTRLYQLLFSKGLNNELPITREHIYCSL